MGPACRQPNKASISLWRQLGQCERVEHVRPSALHVLHRQVRLVRHQRRVAVRDVVQDLEDSWRGLLEVVTATH